jgi:hypothetical protein
VGDADGSVLGEGEALTSGDPGALGNGDELAAGEPEGSSAADGAGDGSTGCRWQLAVSPPKTTAPTRTAKASTTKPTIRARGISFIDRGV